MRDQKIIKMISPHMEYDYGTLHSKQIIMVLNVLLMKLKNKENVSKKYIEMIYE